MKAFKDYSGWDWDNMMCSYFLGGITAALIVLIYQILGVV